MGQKFFKIVAARSNPLDAKRLRDRLVGAGLQTVQAISHDANSGIRPALNARHLRQLTRHPVRKQPVVESAVVSAVVAVDDQAGNLVVLVGANAALRNCLARSGAEIAFN